MPTYDYKCEACDLKFEQFQNINDDALKKCPECAGKVIRLITAGAGIIFKGNGFYQTDYKNCGSKDKDTSGKDKKPAACQNADKCPYKS